MLYKQDKKDKAADENMQDIQLHFKEEETHVRKRRFRQKPGSMMPEDGEVPAKKKHGLLKRLLIGAAVLLLAALLTFCYSIWSEYSAVSSSKGKDIEVTIEKGSTTRDMARQLKSDGVIRYESSFLLKIYFSPYKGKLRYGTFQLNDGMCLADIIESMATGGALKEERAFTMPEGYTIEMTAQKLEKEGIMSKKEFLAAVENAAAGFEYAAQYPEKAQVTYQLQGYLYPDTYFIGDDTTGDELVEKMLTEFKDKFDEDRQEAARKDGFTVEEVLIRASLVQKETELPEEYAAIAGVINNRLEKNMRLQFDSTVVYPLSKGLYGFDRVTYKDLEVDSPYNTYQIYGLPAGPICNPSIEAIDAVLHPEEHNYLFFQMDKTKNDGSNVFSETYEEHSAASQDGKKDNTSDSAAKKK